MILFLILISLAHAKGIDPTGPGPVRPARCLRDLIAKCKEENFQALTKCRMNLNHDERVKEIQLLNLREIQHSLHENEMKISSLAATNEMIAREINFLELSLFKNEKKNWREPTLVPLEILFEINIGEKKWHELFPSERLSRLLSVQIENKNSLIGLNSSKLAKNTQIQALKSQIEALIHDISMRQQEEKKHAFMLEFGCENQFCSPDQ